MWMQQKFRGGIYQQDNTRRTLQLTKEPIMLMSWTGLAVLVARPGTDREHLGGAHNTRVRTSTTTEQR